MAFADEIRVEIENYIALYDAYKNADFSEQFAILAKALKMEEERYKSDVQPLHTQIKTVEKALNSLKKFKNTAEKIAKLINQGLDSGTIDDATIKSEYNKLQNIRQDIMAALPNGIPAGVDELDYAKKYLTQRQEELLSLRDYSYLELERYMTDPERRSVAKLMKALKSIVIKDRFIDVKAYPNLLQLLALATFNRWCTALAPKLPDKFSIVCRNMFDSICGQLCSGMPSFAAKMQKFAFEKVNIGCTMDFEVKTGLYFCAFEQDEETEAPFIISKQFLNSVLAEIEENSALDLVDMAKVLFQKYGVDKKVDRNIASMLGEFTRLYKETPAQVLITEQRYYRERELAERREQAELDRRSREEQAERDRELQRELQEEQWRRENEENRRIRQEQARFEREELNRQRRERWAAEERREQERRDRDNQRRAEARAQREAGYKARDASRKAMHLCWKCANYCNGCQGGIVGCGNFRPKR